MPVSIESKGYCPSCEEEVYLTYERIEPCVLIILGLFTIGIGIIIYYLMRKPTRCIKCGAYSHYSASGKLAVQKGGEVLGSKALFCDFCGTELNRENQEFCPNCGSKV